MRRLLLMVLFFGLAGCGDEQGEVDMGGEELGADRFAIETRGGEVKLGLTDRYVYLALTDESREQARQEVDEELGGGDGLGGVIGSVVGSAVNKALGFRTRYDVDAIREVRWEDDRLVIEFEDGGRRLDESTMKIDGQPVSESFAEEDVRAFAEAFDQVKGERGRP